MHGNPILLLKIRLRLIILRHPIRILIDRPINLTKRRHRLYITLRVIQHRINIYILHHQTIIEVFLVSVLEFMAELSFLD